MKRGNREIVLLFILAVAAVAIISLPSPRPDEKTGNETAGSRETGIAFSFDEGEGGKAFSADGEDFLAVAGPLWVDGVNGSALEFYSEYVAYSRSLNVSVDEPEIVFWIRPGNTPADSRLLLEIAGHYKEGETALKRGWLWYRVKTPVPGKKLVYREGDLYLRSNRTRWERDRWYQVRIVHEEIDGAEPRRVSRMYVDGDLEASRRFNHSTHLKVSELKLGGSGFSGSIDELSIQEDS